jgi:long-chain acyl-CoA synthetase
MTAYTPRFAHLVELFQRSVETYADRPAFGTLRGREWVFTTYAELDKRVALARAALALLGVGRGDRVAIVCENRIEWVILAHATFQRRAIFVPMSEAQHDAELKYTLSDSAAKVCFAANASVAARVASLREDLLDLQHVISIEGSPDDRMSFNALLAQGAERSVSARTPTPADIATIIYTSGTTGEPKGVRLSHQNLASNAAALSEMRDYGPDPRCLAFLPWAHVFGGCVELNLAMAVGATVAICRNADQFFEEMARFRPTMIYAVPRIWQAIYYDMQRELAREPEMSRHMFDLGVRLRGKQQRGEQLSLSERISLNLAEKLVIGKIKARLGGRLRLAFSGAAPLPVEVAEFLHAVGITIHEGYGLTESSGSTTTNPTGAARIGSVGKPLLGTTIAIERRRGGAGHDPREGEVIIYGPGVMSAYHNRPKDSAAVLGPDGGLRTGDLGYLDEDGYLYITGRVKELYKLNNGRYVAPAPLEEKLKLSPFISNCMVYGAGQPYNVALVVADVPALQSYFGGLRDAHALAADRRVRRLFEDEILKHSRDFRTFELVRNFWLETAPFTRENGMLTPTFKLRRELVRQRYEGKLLTLYG